MVSGLFTIATFLVGTITRKMASLLTFLASDFVHIGRFLPVNTYHKPPENYPPAETSDESQDGGKHSRKGEGEGGYRTVPGTMSFSIAVATQEFLFLRTICADMTRLLTATTSDRSQKLLGKRLVAFFRRMSFLTTKTHVNSSHRKKCVYPQLRHPLFLVGQPRDMCPPSLPKSVTVSAWGSAGSDTRNCDRSCRRKSLAFPLCSRAYDDPPRHN